MERQLIFWATDETGPWVTTILEDMGKPINVRADSRVDFNELAQHLYNLRETLISMGWMDYFEITKDPCYSELVKEF